MENGTFYRKLLWKLLEDLGHFLIKHLVTLVVPPYVPTSPIPWGQRTMWFGRHNGLLIWCIAQLLFLGFYLSPINPPIWSHWQTPSSQMINENHFNQFLHSGKWHERELKFSFLKRCLIWTQLLFTFRFHWRHVVTCWRILLVINVFNSWEELTIW